jgi:hypothetical protein
LTKAIWLSIPPHFQEVARQDRPLRLVEASPQDEQHVGEQFLRGCDVAAARRYRRTGSTS